jgi:hypothetical protein
MTVDLKGTWRLLSWRRLTYKDPSDKDPSITYPFGEDATGILVYGGEGRMAVQMAAARRPGLATTDPLGGDVDARAAAYSSCLAYFGGYEVKDDKVIHRIDASLYPNWSGAEQARPFTLEGDRLVLRTPPGLVVNEMAWIREEAARARAARFLDLSVLLTGFGRLQLLGTGMADGHLRALDLVLPVGTVEELLAAYERLPAGAEREAAVTSTLLEDPKLGPVARNLIRMWYCGTWTSLPDDWRAAYGTSPLDTDRVLSAEAFQAALQWVVAGAHPPGARQQGFGSWAEPPREERS